MPRPKGKPCQQVNKCTLPDPITSVIQEINGVKRKITAAKPLGRGLAKKSKQDLNYSNPAIASPAHIATRDAGHAHIATRDASPAHIATRDASPAHIATRDAGPAHIATRDAGPAHIATRDAGPSTSTVGLDILSQQPLKFQELQNIKKVIRNWKPPPLRKPNQVTPSTKEEPKQTEAAKKCQQESKTMKKESEVITSTLVPQKEVPQRGHSDAVDEATLPGDGDAKLSDPIDTAMRPGDAKLRTKPIANPELHEDTSTRNEKVSNEVMPLQASPGKMKLVDETDELTIGNSQLDMKTCKNLPNKNEDALIIDLAESETKGCDSQDLFEGGDELQPQTRDEVIVIDETEGQIKLKGNNSQDIDLFEDEEIYTDQYHSLKWKIHNQIGNKPEEKEKIEPQTRDEVIVIDETEGQIKLKGNNSQDIDLFEDEEIYTNQYHSLKWKIHNKIGNKPEEKEKIEESLPMDTLNENQQCNGVTPPDSCDPTDDPFVTPEREAMCTPTNNVNLQDITPPTVKRINNYCSPTNNVNLLEVTPTVNRINNCCTEEIGTSNESKHIEGSNLTVTPIRTRKVSTLEESPLLFSDKDSDGDIEELNQKGKVQEDRLSLSDFSGEQSKEDLNFSHHLNFNRDQVQSKIQLKMSDQCSIVDELNGENGSKYIECKKAIHSSKHMQIYPSNDNNHSSTAENIGVVNSDYQDCHHESNNTLSQSKGIICVATTCQKSQNELDKICLQNKDMNYFHPTNNCTQKSQNETSNALFSDQNIAKSHNLNETEKKSVQDNDGLTNTFNKDVPSTNNASGSQKSLDQSNSTPTVITPSATTATWQTSQNGPEESIISLNNDVTPPQSITLTPQYNASQKSLNRSNNPTTPSKDIKDPPSAQSTGQTARNAIDNITIAIAPNIDVKPHSMPLTPQSNASEQSFINPSTPIKGLPSAPISSQTLSQHKPNNQGHMFPTKKPSQTSASQPDNVCRESNDVKENRQPYLYEMDQDFDLISSSQLLAIEDELKHEMLQESAYNGRSGSKPAEGQVAPRNVATPCEGARMPLFSLATRPPLQQPFDWTRQVHDDRQKLKGIVQEMSKLNAMIAKVRQEMWPRRRPDGIGNSVRRLEDIPGSATMPPPQASPSGAYMPPQAGPSGAYKPPPQASPSGAYMPPQAGPSGTYKPPPQAGPSGAYKPPPQAGPSGTYKPPPQAGPSGTYKPPPQAGPSGAYKPPPQVGPSGAYMPPQAGPSGTYKPPPQAGPSGAYMPPQAGPSGTYKPPPQAGPSGAYMPPQAGLSGAYLPPLQAGPSGAYGGALPPGNWGRGHGRY